VIKALGVETPKKGPALQRFDSELRQGVIGPGVRPDLTVIGPTDAVFAVASPDCARRAVLCLSVPAAGRTMHFVDSDCEACEAPIPNLAWAADADGRLAITWRDPDDEPPETPCPGQPDPTPLVAVPVELRPATAALTDDESLVAWFGGSPWWVQANEFPDCPRCKRLMFFAGKVLSDSLRSPAYSSVLFGFVCEDCGVQTQIAQST
jgi:hypothetical protein